METNLGKIKVLLVDDHPAFLHLLELILNDLGIVHLAKASSYDEGLKQYRQFHPDICLLDIDLVRGLKNGIDLADSIRKENVNIPIVFLTSHFDEDFYKKIKHVRPSSFMNKELSRLKLLQAIELAVLQIDNHELIRTEKQQEAEKKAEVASPYFNSSQLFFKIRDMYKAIDITTIDFFFAENKFTYAPVVNRNFPTNVQLKVLTNELGPKFLRCHKKYLINVD